MQQSDLWTVHSLSSLTKDKLFLISETSCANMTCWTYRTKYKVSFIVMILLTIVLFLSKIFIGYKQNSLSLISGSFHLISDIAALVIGYSALRFAEQRVDGKYTFGVVRAEVLGATVNAIFLIAICFSLTVESLKRLIVPDQVENPEPVLIVGIIGLFINSVGLFLFRCKNCSCRQKRKKQPNKVVRYKKFSTDLKTEDSSSQSSRSGMYSKNNQENNCSNVALACRKWQCVL